jgi:hypothetical protein
MPCSEQKKQTSAKGRAIEALFTALKYSVNVKVVEQSDATVQAVDTEVQETYTVKFVLNIQKKLHVACSNLPALSPWSNSEQTIIK